jgi:hypothetical protein
MTIPAGTIVAQNQLLYKKVPAGQTPIIFTVMCNCGSSQRDKTARFVDANRHLFITPEMFKKGEWA